MKVDKRQIFCVCLGIMFCLAGNFVDKRSSELLEGHILRRNSYGQGDKTQEVMVDGLLDEVTPLDLSLGERQYRREEAEAVFPEAFEEILALMPGENGSLSHVSTDLNLPSALPEYGISVRWESEDSALVEPSGKVHGEECPKAGQEIELTALLQAGEYSGEYVVRTVVFPPARTEEEERQAAFEKLIRSLDEEQRATERLILPEEYGEQQLRYEVKHTSDSWIFLPLGIFAALLLPLREKQKEKEQKKKRERQMLLDYSEIISKLVVFLGAGLPVRRAWERIVNDYEQKAKESGEPRFAYEEMKSSYYLMGRGIPETRAYAEFGNRCRLLPYRKLAGLLEQNVKNGAESLRPLLEAEMEDAFEQRKTLARRMGEETGTKLLLPLFMMLAVVMVIISVPAFLSFGL